jgi:hypothetical protein
MYFEAALEYSHGIELPDEVHSDPVVSELALAGNQILTWMNDIYSFSVSPLAWLPCFNDAKFERAQLEQAKGYTHNILFVVMSNKKVELQAAVDFVEEMIKKRIKEYLDTKASLPSFGPELDNQVTRYIQGIEYCIQANINWSLMTPRKLFLSISWLCDIHVLGIGYFGPDFAKVKETRLVKLMAPITKRDQIIGGNKAIESMESIVSDVSVDIRE